MNHDHYDLFVIGGGSGGVRAARVAAGYGARTAIAESSRFGGTCVIRGCVPKKLLVYASRFADEFEDAAGFGWTLPSADFDWPKLIAAKDKEIARLEAVYESNLLKSGVTLYRDQAEFVGPNAIRLHGEGRTVTAERILIATGGRPQRMQDLPGSELAITSDEVFQLAQLPPRVVVVGGGYIAVEFACLLHGLGAQTTLVYRGEQILRGFDDDLRRALAAAMRQRGIEIVLQGVPRRIARVRGALEVELSDGHRVDADRVLLAVGRSPNTAGLGLESAGVQTNADGSVRVDAYSRTSVPGVFAVGDVTNRVNLTPAAIREGQAFAETEFGGRTVAVDHALVPTGVFTTPELGTVGLTEAQARQGGVDVQVYKSEFRPLKATLSGSAERVLMKLVVDRATDRVLGAHMLGPDAGDTAQLLAVALRLGVTKADLDATLAVHPTAAEEWVTMK